MTVRYPKRFDAKLLKRYLKEKRGEGEGASYIPWVQIYDLPSDGLSSIVPGWKTEGRDHHVLSTLELNFFYLGSWSRKIVDIREQFPLLSFDRKRPPLKPLLKKGDSRKQALDMTRNRRKTGEEAIQKLVREGRGQGELAEYQPWLTVRDVPSRGLSTRSKGWKTGRIHHLLSKLERKYFYVLEWSKIVVDIREQYPLLPLDDTLAIAKQCGFGHPAIPNKDDPKELDPVVMTTDFFIILMVDGKRIEQARTVKYAADLQSASVLRKLEIERRFWEVRQINWGIVTEHDIPMVLADNVELLYPNRYLDEDSRYSRRELHSIATILTKSVQESTLSLRYIALDCDTSLGFMPGTSLSVAYFLIANRYWEIDMHVPIQPGKRLVLLKQVDLSKLNPGG